MELVQDVTGSPPHRGAALDRDVDAALTLLHRRHYAGLVRLAVVLVDSQASAEEVVQQAYVDVLRRSGTGPILDDAAAYLRRAVLNGARDRLRRRRVRRAFSLPHAVSEPGPEDELLLKEQHRAALDALRDLPPRQREVLALRHLSGLSEAETAAALGISVSAAKSAAHKGIANLRARLESEAGS